MEQRDGRRPRWWIRGLVPAVLIGLGLVHSAVGLTAGRRILLEVVHEGFWDTAHSGSQPISRPLLLWFLVSGLVLIILGHLALWVERHLERPLPRALGAELLVLGAALGVVSGGALPAWLIGTGGLYVLLVAAGSGLSDRGRRG